jgi:triosephosphate isomerase
MRRPLIVLNWKMAMTLNETRAFVDAFQAADEGRAAALDLVVCPPATALTTLADLAEETSIQVGAQNISTETEPAHTGQLSGALLADAGATWVLIGHYEVRRDFGDDWATLNMKIKRALDADLRPVLLLGEDQRDEAIAAQIRARVETVFADCTVEQITRMGFVYEPSWAIGQDEPAPPKRIEEGARALRDALTNQFGNDVGDRVQVIYGGSVTPQIAEALLDLPSLDGLGMGRKGREPEAVAALVKQVMAKRHKGAPDES